MSKIFDLFIIGGGINGVGIARDATGRGYKVCLADKGNIGSATSSWSSKLIHGGLRYLENYEFKLVRESLIEREIIRNIASSITKPLPFVIPHTSSIRSEWFVRLGLLIYDNLGGKSEIPKSSKINIQQKYPNILKSNFITGFQYYDLQVDDKKLTEMNALDAKKRGALIIENNEVVKVERSKDFWKIYLKDRTVILSKVLINASGPWVNNVTKNVLKINSKKKIRLIKGSHIVTKKVYDQQIAFTLQNDDNRIVFIIPYKDSYSLIGTTEVEVEDPENPKIDVHEINYLLNAVNKFCLKQISENDILDTYSGIRPLIEDYQQASKVTRDFIFDINSKDNAPPLFNIYGGKLTTYRKLAENVLEKLQNFLPSINKNSWTSKEKL